MCFQFLRKTLRLWYFCKTNYGEIINIYDNYSRKHVTDNVRAEANFDVAGPVRGTLSPEPYIKLDLLKLG